MAYALPLGAPAPERSKQNDLRWTVGLSILFHIAVGWVIVNQLIGVPALEADPEPQVITIEPYVKPPPPPIPEIQADPPKLKEIPRVQPRPTPIVPDAPKVDPIPIPPQPPIPGEPTVTSLPETVPTAAPQPTERVPVRYPVRAQDREIEGSATVQITVAPGGAVSDVQIVSETPENYHFGEAAADAVWQWKFADAQPGTYRVTVRFKLN
ncbi:hypothetical protein sos41_23370 [Alphaproteobacteria bacterium SO-S41]|nr:hypothetical protein sos41_23370 [Alphaproteobacteria bacterium SO-S41]